MEYTLKAKYLKILVDHPNKAVGLLIFMFMEKD